MQGVPLIRVPGYDLIHLPVLESTASIKGGREFSVPFLQFFWCVIVLNGICCPKGILNLLDSSYWYPVCVQLSSFRMCIVVVYLFDMI